MALCLSSDSGASDALFGVGRENLQPVRNDGIDIVTQARIHLAGPMRDVKEGFEAYKA